MKKRQELADPSSCLNRAHEEEWLFVLRGCDEAAPVTVRAWIEKRIALGKNTRQDTQILDAEQWIATVTRCQLAGGQGCETNHPSLS